MENAITVQQAVQMAESELNSNPIKVHNKQNIVVPMFCKRTPSNEDAERRLQIEIERMRADIELVVTDYIVYGKLHDIHANIMEAAEAAGKLKGFSKEKKLLHQCKRDIDSLLLNCGISERCEVMRYITAPFPYYHKEYTQEGSSFINNLQFRWQKATQNTFHTLYYAALNSFNAIKVEHPSYCAHLLIAYCLCKVLQDIAEQGAERLSKQTGLKAKNVMRDECIRYIKSINEILDINTGERSFSDYNKQVLNVGVQSIYESIAGKKGVEIINICHIQSASDYAYHCLAAMIVDTRAKGAITRECYNNLTQRAGLTPRLVGKLQTAMRNIKWLPGSTDVQDIKDHLIEHPMLPIFHKFRKTLTITFEE